MAVVKCPLSKKINILENLCFKANSMSHKNLRPWSYMLVHCAVINFELYSRDFTSMICYAIYSPCYKMLHIHDINNCNSLQVSGGVR